MQIVRTAFDQKKMEGFVEPADFENWTEKELSFFKPLMENHLEKIVRIVAEAFQF